MKVASLNISGFSSKPKCLTLFHWAEQNHIDILCLQETFCTQNNFDQVDKDWSGDIYHCLSDSSHSRGVAILFRKYFQYKFLNCHRAIEGRKIIVNFKHNDDTYSVSSIYAPNEEKSRIMFKNG